MEKHGIMVYRDKRRAIIQALVIDRADDVGGITPDDPDLLNEVTDLVEAPHALGGAFETKHLLLPREVLISVMKKHQRYFPVLDKKTGELKPCFITISNGKPDAPALVVRGNEGVIHARYTDAEFFYKDDTKQKLDAYLPRLDTLTFQEDLGSMRDKIRRIEKLVGALSPKLGLSDEQQTTALRAAALCKADLATSMVVEMTSLQGIMGRYYALASGETEAVAKAIEDHYHPRYPGDSLPETLPGLAVSLADRLDSLAGLFAAGIKPRSTADPYGLRRDALGLLTGLIGHKQRFSLRHGLKEASKLLPVTASQETLDETLDFVMRRFEVQLRDEGFRHDVVAAAITSGSDDPYHIRRVVETLTQITQASDWRETLNAHARCKRIVRDLKETYTLHPEADTDEASKTLHAAYQVAHQKLTSAEDPIAILEQILIDLRDPINGFFNSVLVMAKEPDLKSSRLALVQHIAALPATLIDLSLLEGF
jgi:glycyl-tRNA synthetase